MSHRGTESAEENWGVVFPGCLGTNRPRIASTFHSRFHTTPSLLGFTASRHNLKPLPVTTSNKITQPHYPLCLCGYDSSWLLVEPGEDEGVEGVVGGFEQPAEVGVAVEAEGDAPGVAGEPAEFGGGFADGAAAGGFVEAADAEDDAGGIGEAVFEAAVAPGAMVRVSDFVFALGAEDGPVGVVDGVLEGVGNLLEVAAGSGGFA